jgi:hypothetical protein
MSVLDGLTIGITVSIFILFFLNGTLVVGSVNSAFITLNAITPQMSTYNVYVSAINSIYGADTWVVILYFGLWIVAILTAAFLESDTINLPLGIFMGIITIIISFVISNAMHAIVANPAYSGIISHFTDTQLILANLGTFTALFIIVYVLVILARPLGGGGGISRNSIEVLPG